MKKKKNLSKIAIIIFIFSIIILIFLIVILIFLSQKPHFKITKEECRNETVIEKITISFLTETINDDSPTCKGIYYDEFVDDAESYEKIIVNFFYDYYYDEEEVCKKINIINETYISKTKEVILFNGEKENITVYDIKRIFLVEGLYPNETLKQACEEVEVEEIIIDKLNLERARECSAPLGDTKLTIIVSVLNDSEFDVVDIANTTINLKRCTDDEIYKEKILKQDLSVDWLYYNCICNIFSLNLPTSFTNEEAMKYCLEYKCGDYYVETWNQIK